MADLPAMQPDLAAALAAGREGEGIGTLNERTLHGVLKCWLQPDPACREISLGRAVADIFDGQRVTEVQTGSLFPLQKKLPGLLEHWPVTVVCPLPRRKWICWIDPSTGEQSPPRRSPRTGTPADLLPELVWVREFLSPASFPHPLTLRILLVDMIEYRVQDGWGSGGKRGAHRADRLPLQIGGEVFVRSPAEGAALCPPLPDPFTRGDLAKVLGHTGVALSRALKFLELSGAVTRIGKQGRRILFSRVAQNDTNRII